MNKEIIDDEKNPTQKEKINATLLILLILLLVLGIGYLIMDLSSEDEEVPIEEVTTIDLESEEGKNLISKIEDKYGQEIYFLQENKIVDFTTLSKVEKICLGIKEPDITVNISDSEYPGYTEKQILINLKEMFGKEIKVDPLEEMGGTLIYQEICPSSVLTYSSENAAYYVKPLELTEPLPDVISKITRIEKQDNNLIVYGSAIFRDSKGIVYKNLDDKVQIAEFELNEDGTSFKELSKDNHPMEYYLQNSYQYTFTFTDDENLYWIDYERSEQ